jgi:hypothetical protein
LRWLIEEDAVALVDGELDGSATEDAAGSPDSDEACAAETALPLLKFIAAWLHEKLFDVPAVQVAL